MSWHVKPEPGLAERIDWLENEQRPESVLAGFEHVASAADDAAWPIIRHLRHEAHHHSTERAHGTAMTTDLSGSPRARSHGRLRRATPTSNREQR